VALEVKREFLAAEEREAELEEELRSHLKLSAQDRWTGRKEGRREHAARRSLEYGIGEGSNAGCMGWRWLRDVADDARYGMRMLLKNPGFAIVAVLSLALASAPQQPVQLVYGVLVNPYPYANSDRMVHLVPTTLPATAVTSTSPGRNCNSFGRRAASKALPQ